MTTAKEYDRIYNIGFENAKRELIEDVEKLIKELNCVRGCKYADNRKIGMIQREELLKKLNKLTVSSKR